MLPVIVIGKFGEQYVAEPEQFNGHCKSGSHGHSKTLSFHLDALQNWDIGDCANLR